MPPWSSTAWPTMTWPETIQLVTSSFLSSLLGGASSGQQALLCTLTQIPSSLRTDTSPSIHTASTSFSAVNKRDVSNSSKGHSQTTAIASWRREVSDGAEKAESPVWPEPVLVLSMDMPGTASLSEADEPPIPTADRTSIVPVNSDASIERGNVSAAREDPFNTPAPSSVGHEDGGSIFEHQVSGLSARGPRAQSAPPPPALRPPAVAVEHQIHHLGASGVEQQEVQQPQQIGGGRRHMPVSFVPSLRTQATGVTDATLPSYHSGVPSGEWRIDGGQPVPVLRYNRDNNGVTTLGQEDS
ncbi:hypothetical protein K488DRAFT_72257 [Vararia minispora EC-137]|uniref:Uncharacterized protein n=1 Tax=Vararia minispora EC-137 TaxID=1314806 RepID=A0ACB8QEV4_9AGAM|nr:hypothetical protein K488DRAFT_72257 [Vararia minispora EC-137]